MPYIPAKNRPNIDDAVSALSKEIADTIAENNETAEFSTYLKKAFMDIARTINEIVNGQTTSLSNKSSNLAMVIHNTALCYNQISAWSGELNYALTRLIQLVPAEMVIKGQWDEPLRYWIFAGTVGALDRAAWEIDKVCDHDYIGNCLCGVLIDVKDEYKRRVNTAYEAVQILKSGDCFDDVPYKTQLVQVEINGIKGYQEVMLID